MVEVPIIDNTIDRSISIPIDGVAVAVCIRLAIGTHVVIVIEYAHQHRTPRVRVFAVRIDKGNYVRPAIAVQILQETRARFFSEQPFAQRGRTGAGGAQQREHQFLRRVRWGRLRSGRGLLFRSSPPQRGDAHQAGSDNGPPIPHAMKVIVVTVRNKHLSGSEHKRLLLTFALLT